MIAIEDSVPAAGQGAIGLQVRTGDVGLYDGLLCEKTAKAVHLERALLAAMGGGCHSATAAHLSDGKLHVFDESFGYKSVDLPVGKDWLAEEFIESLMEDFRS